MTKLYLMFYKHDRFIRCVTKRCIWDIGVNRREARTTG